MTFRALDAGKILGTLEQLTQRIEERFPGSGLGRLARDLLGLSRDCAREADLLGRPNWPVRVGGMTLAAVMLGGVIYTMVTVARLGRGTAGGFGFGEFLQSLDAAVNEAVFLAIATWFLASIESRLKRRKALRWLHQLRSVAHIVDMHQLTKDPDRLLASRVGDTESSPERTMTAGELGRYLDYCTELLSLTGKLAALFVQRFDDPVVLQAVNEIEDLTNGLARKVWQKITLLQSGRLPGGDDRGGVD